MQGMSVEQAISSGEPILKIGTAGWEEDRRSAFISFYAVMRAADDLVDNSRKNFASLSSEEKNSIAQFLASLMNGNLPAGAYVSGLLNKVFADTAERQKTSEALDKLNYHLSRFNTYKKKYNIPDHYWKSWLTSMFYDIDHSGFPTFRAFLSYAYGAAVIPGMIYLHLCGSFDKGGLYLPPPVRLCTYARPIAVFCYVVHILLDFNQDITEGLLYFPEKILLEYNLDIHALRSYVQEKKNSLKVEKLFQKYKGIAEYYRIRAEKKTMELKHILAERYAVSIETVFRMYEAVLREIGKEPFL